jgi:hypothetical protein
MTTEATGDLTYYVMRLRSPSGTRTAVRVMLCDRTYAESVVRRLNALVRGDWRYEFEVAREIKANGDWLSEEADT